MRGAAVWAGLVVVAAVALSASQWGHRVPWTIDGLFYEAQALELRGRTAQDARAEVFRDLRPAIPRQYDRYITDPHWFDYSSRFYRRRWTVSATAAAIWPLAHERGIFYVSLAGYIAAGVLLFMLARRQAADWIAALSTLVILTLPPVREWSFKPLTDSSALALEAAALLALLAVHERGRRWLPAWVLLMLLLALTRDLTLVPLGAALALLIQYRDRIHALLLATGAIAAIPVALILGAPFGDLIRYEAGGEVPNPGASLLASYHHIAVNLVRDDLYYLRHHPTVALTVALGVIGLFLLARAGFWVWVGAALGYLAVVALNPFASAFRYEFGALPVLAVGMAFLLDRARARVRPSPAGLPSAG